MREKGLKSNDTLAKCPEDEWLFQRESQMDEVTGVDPPEYNDPLRLHGNHLLTCRTVWFDYQKLGACFSLGQIFTHVEPPEGVDFPLRLHSVFVYVQLWGDPGEYRLRVRIVRIADSNEDDDEEELHLGPDGEPREFPMPSKRPAVVSGIEYRDQIAFAIGPVWFREPGLYEYQLWADGIDEPIARERVLARR